MLNISQIVFNKNNWIREMFLDMGAIQAFTIRNAPFLIDQLVQMLILGSIVVIVAVTTWMARWHFQRRRLYALGRLVKGPTAYPIIGSAYVLFGNNIDLVKNIFRLRKEYGSTYKIWLGPHLTYMLSNVKDIDILLTSYKAMDKAVYYSFLDPFVGQSVFNAKLERWRKLRRIIEPTFGKKVIENFMEVFSTESKNLVRNIELKRKQEDKSNLYELLGICTFENLCQAAMGIKLDSEKTAPEWFDLINSGMQIIITRMLKPWLHMDFIFGNTKDGKYLNNRMVRFRKYAQKIIEEKRHVLESKKNKNEFVYVEEDTKRKAFLDLLLEMQDKNDILTDKELLDEVITILVAGTDSTTTTLCYILEMIGMHPEVQEKVYDEIMEVFKNTNDANLSYKDILKLKYLDRVIKESMRILPSVMVIGRTISEELQLDTCTLPAGAIAAVDILNLHRDPELWVDPLRFNPDRFLPSECAKRSVFAWIPFAAGPRSCLGMQFSIVEIKTMLAYLLQQYKVTTEYKSIKEIKLMLNFLTKPAEGFKFNLQFRSP